jgi:hypothetical protein
VVKLGAFGAVKISAAMPYTDSMSDKNDQYSAEETEQRLQKFCKVAGLRAAKAYSEQER